VKCLTRPPLPPLCLQQVLRSVYPLFQKEMLFGHPSSSFFSACPNNPFFPSFKLIDREKRKDYPDSLHPFLFHYRVKPSFPLSPPLFFSSHNQRVEENVQSSLLPYFSTPDVQRAPLESPIYHAKSEFEKGFNDFPFFSYFPYLADAPFPFFPFLFSFNND